MTWRFLWAIATNPWRFLKAFFAPTEHGIVPLELSSTCIEREQLTNEEIALIREGRIPEACIHRLSEGAMGRAGGALALFFNIAIMIYMAWASREEYYLPGPGRWIYPSLITGTLFLAAIATAFWCHRPRRDLREQRLRVEEGELKSKWIRTYNHDNGVKSTKLHARIGWRAHEIRSSYLFGALGSGVRYRLFMSKYSGQLIALESIEEISGAAGYRSSAGDRRTGARGPVRPGE